jgi:hypothetical protein
MAKANRVFPVEPGDYAALVRASNHVGQAVKVLDRLTTPELGLLGTQAGDAARGLADSRAALEDVIQALGKAVPLLGAAADTLEASIRGEVD